MICKRAVVIVVFSFVLARPSRAQTHPSIDSVFDALHSLSTFSSVAISPDGSRVAWVQNIDESPESRRSAIWVAAVGGAGKPARITAARDGKSHRERDVAWSPDGKSIAFLSDADQERQLEIYVAPASGGAARRVTGVSGQLEHPPGPPTAGRLRFSSSKARLRSRARSSLTSSTPGWSRKRSRSSGSPSPTRPPARFVPSPPPISSSMSMTGRRTARASPRPARKAPERTTTGLPSSTRFARTVARLAPSGSRRSRSRARDGPPTDGRSP
jgi:hypothetical protein